MPASASNRVRTTSGSGANICDTISTSRLAPPGEWNGQISLIDLCPMIVCFVRSVGFVIGGCRLKYLGLAHGHNSKVVSRRAIELGIGKRSNPNGDVIVFDQKIDDAVIDREQHTNVGIACRKWGSECAERSQRRR